MDVSSHLLVRMADSNCLDSIISLKSFLALASRSQSSKNLKGKQMEPDKLAFIFVMITAICTGFFGLIVGMVLGFFIGRYEANRKGTKSDFDKLKRSDHFHYERKGKKS